jgi:glutamyl-tRNA reductase
VGVNHLSGAGLLRERLQGDEGDVARLLARARDLGLKRAIVVATCDRCEFWSVTEDAPLSREAALGALAEAADLDVSQIAPQVQELREEAALRYAFRVAASLESRVVGEPQVLGQVKDLHQLAQRLGSSSPPLDRVMDAAYQAAKRVRSETGIAGQSVSMASSAVNVLRQMHGAIGSLRALLIGDGDMGQLIQEQMASIGLVTWTMIHSQEQRARTWAEQRRAHWRPFEELANALVEADLVVGALESGRPVLSAEMVEAALVRRKRRPILLVDAAVPGDVEPGVNALDDAFLYGLEDLERLAMAGRLQRSGEAVAAMAIIDQAVAQFQRQREEQEAAPAISDLRRHFETLREEILRQDGLDAGEATRRLVNRLLHRPTMELKASAPERELEAALRRLFGLNDGDD